jgi:hypothetical protein
MYMRSERSKADDEKNTDFGFQRKVMERKSGFNREPAKQEAEKGEDGWLSPSEEKDIPQESLAARIGKTQKGE